MQSTTDKTRKFRDPGGQMLAVMSVIYIFVGAVFAIWVLNSGLALNYKSKLMMAARQGANIGALFMYYAPEFNPPWTWGTVYPYVLAGLNDNPGILEATGLSFAAPNDVNMPSSNTVTVGIQSSTGGMFLFGGWAPPEPMQDIETVQIPAGTPPCPP